MCSLHYFTDCIKPLRVLQLTKIFRFETAHAIYNYNGKCCNLHGHSYELHVTVSDTGAGDEHIEGAGFVIDFKVLKQLVMESVVDHFDHKVILSKQYLAAHPELGALPNLVAWKTEPSAENMLVYIRTCIMNRLPEGTRLRSLKLYETADSYAEWICG